MGHVRRAEGPGGGGNGVPIDEGGEGLDEGCGEGDPLEDDPEAPAGCGEDTNAAVDDRGVDPELVLRKVKGEGDEEPFVGDFPLRRPDRPALQGLAQQPNRPLGEGAELVG